MRSRKMRCRHPLPGLSCVAAVLFGSACDGADLAPGDGSAGTTSGDGSADPTPGDGSGGTTPGDGSGDPRPGDPLPSGFDSLTLVTVGGFMPIGPPDSECSFLTHRNTFRVDAAAPALHWDLCNYADQWIVGDLTLDAAQFELVRSAVGAVRISDTDSCGADARVLLLDLRTETNVSTFANDFYSGCPWEVHDGRTFVAGLLELYGTLEELTQ